jgi:hypothetical protein
MLDFTFLERDTRGKTKQTLLDVQRPWGASDVIYFPLFAGVLDRLRDLEALAGEALSGEAFSGDGAGAGEAAFFDLLLLRSRLGDATLAAAVGAFLEDFVAVFGSER